MAFRTTLILTLSSAVAAIAVAQPQGSTINFDSNACPDGAGPKVGATTATTSSTAALARATLTTHQAEFKVA
ncbi:hypothetical protein Slin14017_G058600 [Septoria linicola]|nr:hypothetical protein Slin14017_G058600 [Septoria linicola]